MDLKDQRLDKVRQGLKALDDVEWRMPMNEDFFDKLHDSIMAEVEKTEIRPAPRWADARKRLRAQWRSWRYPAGGVSSLFVLIALLMPEFSEISKSMQRAGLASDGEETIIAQALKNPAEWSQTFITAQSEADFFIDVASESFETLSEAKFNNLMGESGR